MKIVGILALGALIVAAFLLYTLFGGSTAEEQQQAAVENNQVIEEDTLLEEERLTGSGTMASIQALGRNFECAISQTTDNDTTVEGTYFVSGGQVRGDFIVEAEGLAEPMVSSLILDGTTMYVWSELNGSTQGITFDTSLAESSTNIDINEGAVSLDETIDYDCMVWRDVDKSIFNPPSDVLFRDPFELMQAGMEFGTLYEEGEF